MAARKVLVSGAGGFIGKPLVEKLKARGDDVVILTRGPAVDGAIHWDPITRELDAASLVGVDAIIHLAGETIAGLWTEKKKRAIINSRREGTSVLAEAAASIVKPPEVFVSSGAIGIYGSRGDEVLTEDSGSGKGFLAEVVQTWEDSAQPARDAGIRTVNLRVGLVVGDGGGMMGPIKPQFKLGAGGKLGSGEQWWSWVTVDDVVDAFIFAIDNPAVSGPYNVAAPNPVTNADFTKALGKEFHRPTIFAAPKFALKLFAGEMAEEMLLASQRIDGSKLEAAGFKYSDADLEPALKKIFG
jgi:uncharacterized protein (TIGR01777 family)